MQSKARENQDKQIMFSFGSILIGWENGAKSNSNIFNILLCYCFSRQIYVQSKQATFVENKSKKQKKSGLINF